MEIKPYNSEDSKKEQVRDMFDSIAPRYDLLNHLLSFNVDKSWRKKLVKRVQERQPVRILDIATGTGDLAILMARKMTHSKVIGSDLSPEMISIARTKVEKRRLPIDLLVADAENLELEDKSFEAVTAAFGVRNFENLSKGIGEMYRVLTDGGRIYILEFSMPKRSFFAWVYKFYFRRILPMIGQVISKDVRAYQYLPESVGAFPEGEDFLKILRDTGFKNGEARRLTFGISTLYVAEK